MSIINNVIAAAERELGIRERGGNNYGPEVRAYLASVGLGQGQPWCAAWINWVMDKGGVPAWPDTGDTWAIEAWARAHNVLHHKPQRGDVFLLLGREGRPIHTGLVISVEGKYVHTIEGNTGGASDTDGDGVFAKTRPIAACSFVRWVDVLGGATAGTPEPDVHTIKLFQRGNKITAVVDGKPRVGLSAKMDGALWAGRELIFRYR